MFPLAERAEAAVASTMKNALRMETSKLIEPHLIGGMLPAKDAAALSAMVATLEEAEGFLTRSGGANRGGAIGLKRVVSTVGLDTLEGGK